MLVTVTVKIDVPIEADDGDGNSLSIFYRACHMTIVGNFSTYCLGREFLHGIYKKSMK